MSRVDDPGDTPAESPPEMGGGQAAIAKRRWIKVWDMPLRLFHWVLALSIVVAFLSSEEASALNDWHVLSGWVAAILLVFRLVWGFAGGEHSRFSDFIRPARIANHVAGLFRGRSEAHLGHNPLGAVAVLLLLALTGLTVWTGAFGGEAMEELHELVAWTLLGLVGLHVAAVILMSIVEKENLARAMISGDKPAARHPGAVDAKPPSALGLVVAALVMVGTAVAVLQYDPRAFTRRSAEAFEHSMAKGAASTHEADHDGDDD